MTRSVRAGVAGAAGRLVAREATIDAGVAARLALVADLAAALGILVRPLALRALRGLPFWALRGLVLRLLRRPLRDQVTGWCCDQHRQRQQPRPHAVHGITRCGWPRESRSAAAPRSIASSLPAPRLTTGARSPPAPRSTASSPPTLRSTTDHRLVLATDVAPITGTSAPEPCSITSSCATTAGIVAPHAN